MTKTRYGPVAVLLGLWWALTACASPAVAPNPNTLQAELSAAWRQAQRGQWSLQWAQSPLPGPLVFEAWLTAAARQQRFEILEADAPGWVGLVYINDGTTAIWFNRLEDTPPARGPAAGLPFAPVSHAWALVDGLLSGQPQSAQTGRSRGDPVQKISLTYSGGQTLTAWLNTQTGFVVRLEVTGPDIGLTLAARSVEPLTAPMPGLFRIRAAP